MITNCANPKCGQPFLYLRPGARLFIVDVPSNPQGSPGTADQGPRKLEHFWLCEHCAATMTLVLAQGSTPCVIATTCEDPPLSGNRLPRQAHGTAPVKARLR